MAADPITSARVERRQWVGIRWVRFVLQKLVVALWKDRKVKAGVGKGTRSYKKRREAAIAALAKRGIEAHGHSGHNIWVPVTDETRCVQGLLDLGWGVTAGERFRLESSPAVRVTIAELLAGRGRRLRRRFQARAGATTADPHVFVRPRR